MSLFDTLTKKAGPKRTKPEEVVTEAQAAFRQRREREAKRFQETTDSEYWFCVCFHTREEKEDFLKAHGLFDIGDKYLDGLRVAGALKRLGCRPMTPKKGV